MIQTIIVILIVATAVIFAVRRVVRLGKGKGDCGCSCQNCPMCGDDNCHCVNRK